MKHFKSRFFAPRVIASYFPLWLWFIVPLSVVTGSLVALFLWLLQLATSFRGQHAWLVLLLPVAGIGISLLYRHYGKNAAHGNNLIIDEIHEPIGRVPARMGVLVIITTIITHLFGGSAGREGTAVQAGGSVAAVLGRWAGLPPAHIAALLTTGIAAGFGAVFGTPITGAVFALEVLAPGRLKYKYLLPCIAASYMANWVTTAWGIPHTRYYINCQLGRLFGGHSPVGYALLLKTVAAGMAFGLAAMCFSYLTRFIKDYTVRYIAPAWLIPAAGGAAIIALTYALGTSDYLGLGVTAADGSGVSIVSAFSVGGVTIGSWFWKLLFTAITLGTGFKGGEVTPLFFIGAALGNVLAGYVGLPVDLLAGLGFIAVFAGAANTPLACTIMGGELFGPAHIHLYALACFTAYYCSGSAGIYHAQRFTAGKYSTVAFWRKRK